MTDSSALHLSGNGGLSVELCANGALRRFDCGDIAIPLFVGNELEGGPTNIYLRRHTEPIEWTPLLGPASPTQFEVHPSQSALVGRGRWLGIEYAIALVFARDSTAWFWHVELTNTGSDAAVVDLTYAQDLALAPYAAVRTNEYYVSQYIDHTPLAHEARGVMIASRQNQAASGKHPWSLLGSLRKGASFATDALQFHGLAARTGAAPVAMLAALPNHRLQHEHSMAVIRDTAIRVESQARVQAGFFGVYRADHPDATSGNDLAHADATVALAEAKGFTSSAPTSRTAIDHRSLFSIAPPLAALDLDEASLRAVFGAGWRHEEPGPHGQPLSFFRDPDRHVVLRAKELRVERPHGHLLRTGRHITPDETSLTSTAWMGGVFHSLLTQGHVSINRCLSTTRSYLGLYRSHGCRAFIEVEDRWQLLGTPSAFEMTPTGCRWVYRHADGQISVQAQAHSDPQELSLAISIDAGNPARCLVALHIAMNGDDGSTPGAAQTRREGDTISVTPAAGSELAQRFPNGCFQIAASPGTQLAQVGGDELLFLDGRSRALPYVCIVTAAAHSADFRMRGHLLSASTPTPLYVDTLAELSPMLAIGGGAKSSLQASVERLVSMVPWYAHNAFVHYLAPRGLEQYSGGGWGTRDVSQGPIELLFALGRIEPIRDVLIRVMSAQNADGDWPQWFMFFERERDIRAADSHGDVVFWPVLALAQYLLASGDAGLLEERVPFFDDAAAPIWEHVQRALAVIEQRRIPGTALAAYGHGDWNDSLQPADPEMRERLCSAWTVTLHAQLLTTLARALRATGRAADAERFEKQLATVQHDFQRLLIADGVLTGYAFFETAGEVRYILHPRDTATGVRASSLAMIHAMLEDLLTPTQTREHLQLIERELMAADGVHLFDRPMAYHGGPQRLFQRAETATFFGREIGLMYMHAHLRYAQALAHIGEAERFFHALCQANPIGIRALVPRATLRQANCYYSSSDAAFEDRYQASAEWDRVAGGSIGFDGGWRVYSSGAGIALSLIFRHLLGLDSEFDTVVIDPVMPAALDGLQVTTRLLGYPFEIEYRVRRRGCGVSALALNGQPLAFTHRQNPHRTGAAIVARDAFVRRLARERNQLSIQVG